MRAAAVNEAAVSVFQSLAIVVVVGAKEYTAISLYRASAPLPLRLLLVLDRGSKFKSIAYAMLGVLSNRTSSPVRWRS